MKFKQGLALTAVLLAGAAVLSGTANSDYRPARYQITSQGDGAWRLDTTTGEMIWCRRVIADYRSEKGATKVTILRGRMFDATVKCFGRRGAVTTESF
jgi:hypothetical protein